MASTQKPDDNDVFPCEATNACTLTPEITVWKRQYFEQEQMVTQGAFLAEDILGSSEPCSTTSPCEIRLRSVEVDGTRVIRPGAILSLMSMGPAAVSVNDAPFHEDVTVDAVRRDATDRNIWIVRLTSRPRLNYFGNRTGPRATLDAVAVHDASGGINSFSLNTEGLKTVLRDAFIEYADAKPVSWPYVPYIGVTNGQDLAYLGKRWFQHAARGSAPIAEPYHRLLVASKRAHVELNCSTALGDTIRAADDQAWRLSYVYQYSIQGGAAGPFRTFYRISPDRGDDPLPLACLDKTVNGLFRRDPLVFEQLDVAHEGVHQYRVNHATRSPDGHGHCAEQEYTGQFICLMNKTWPGSAVDQQIRLDQARLHYLSPGVDSEHMEMRKLKEPTQ
jgi:hypothetical protein